MPSTFRSSRAEKLFNEIGREIGYRYFFGRFAMIRIEMNKKRNNNPRGKG
jgi:hypothetical protein